MNGDELDAWLRERLGERYARLSWQSSGALELAVVALYDDGRLVAIGYGSTRAAATADAFTVRACIPSAPALMASNEKGSDDHGKH